MGFLSRLLSFKLRKHKRFQVMEGAFVVVGSSPTGPKVQILDISEGGMAFVYTGSVKDLEAQGEVSLISGADLAVDKLSYEVRSDVPLASGADTGGFETKRKGIKFKWLGVLDKAQLKDFIKEHAIKK